MKIKVTKFEIDHGRPGDILYCPIALAMNKFGLGPVTVGLDDVEAPNGRIFQLPRSAKRFMFRFDDMKPVKPFNFIIEDD
jgi:hypothetical protein